MQIFLYFFSRTLNLEKGELRNLQEALSEIIYEANRSNARGHREALNTIGDFLGSLREFLENDCIPVTTGMKYKQDQFTGRDPQN